MDSAYLPPGEMQRSTEASIPSKKQICVQCRNRKVNHMDPVDYAGLSLF